METAGIILQLIAGIILALPYLLPDYCFTRADSKVKAIIKWPLNNIRGLLMAVTLITLFIVADFSGSPFLFKMNQSCNGMIRHFLSCSIPPWQLSYTCVSFIMF
jgi:hypothetical protein